MNNDSLILPHHPECMSPEVLTKLLVQHQKLQQQIVSGFVNGLRSGDRLHVLLVGASGIGKTHIVSLICHRLSRHPDLQDSLRIVRFGPTEVPSGLLCLACSLAEKLASLCPEEFSSDLQHITNSLPPADAATAILHRIVQQLQHRSLLLVHENLHLLFHSLTDAEQKHWRAFLQETRRFSTLATAPALFPQISDRNRPCFGFFDIHHLQSLKLAASRQLVLRICRLRKRKNALQILNSPAGLARLQAADLLLAETSAAAEYHAEPDAHALISSASTLLDQQQLSAAHSQLQAVLQIRSASPAQRTFALFAALEPTLELAAPADFLQALNYAFKHGAPESHAFSGNPTRLLSRILRRSPHDWHTFISHITPLFLRHQHGGPLAIAVVRSIATLEQSGLSATQLQLWNSLWQQAGLNCPPMQIALRCLAAAVSVLTSTRATERPLFQLPPEIRQLVRPLLSHSLGPLPTSELPHTFL